MKPSERFFKFPIKLYHAFYLNKIEEEERETNAEHPQEASWVQGMARVNILEISGWYETFSRGWRIEKIEGAGGCDLTLIQTEKQGEFMCMWKRDRFEQEYNLYMDKYQKWVEEEEGRYLQKQEDYISADLAKQLLP